MTIQELYKIYRSSAGVSIDTRTLQAGQLFFALSGENFNGNKFAEQALEKGAVAAVVDDPEYSTSEKTIFTKNTLQLLQELAKHHRQQLKAKIIGITGSNGKTTSKELMNAVLSTSYKTYATEGNLNNHIGVPLTLLRIHDDTEIAIVEMGANHIGEIKSYCQIAAPHYGIITNIGRAHLEGFKSPEGVKKAKSELYQHIEKTKGTAIVNADLHYLLDLTKRINSVFTYGTSDGADYSCSLVAANPLVEVELPDRTLVNSKLIGRYNLDNIMLAAACGQVFNIPSEKIKEGIERYQPSNNRSEVLKIKDCTIILDAYNANPSSMEKALESFAQMEGGKKTVVLGEMYELGKDAEAEHYTVAKKAKDFDQAYLVGNGFKKAADEFGLAHFKDVQALKQQLDVTTLSGMLLVKGSRKVGLERLVRD